MVPNPKVAKAFRAMRVLGIPEEKTKPVLKKLLKLYDKNWELIEEENYRALADAIFDTEELEAVEKEKIVDNTKDCEEEDLPEELEPPLKRLRLRHQDVQASPSFGNSDPNFYPGRSRLEVNECEVNYREGFLAMTDLPQSDVKNARVESQGVQPFIQNKRKQPLLSKATVQLGMSIPSQPDTIKENGSHVESSSACSKDKAKEYLSTPLTSRENYTLSRRSYRATYLKEPKVEPDTDIPPKQDCPTNKILIKPKDEPFTDDAPLPKVPTVTATVDSLSKRDSLIRNASAKKIDGVELLLSQSANGNDETDPSASSNEMTVNKNVNIPLESSAPSKIASPPCGEGTIPALPTIDSLNKASLADGLSSGDLPYAQSSAPISMMHSDTELLEQCLPCEPVNNGMQSDAGVTCNNGEACRQNGSNYTKATDLHCQLAHDGINSLHDVDDIAKGQEKMKISLVNNINNEVPPSFHYVPKNVIFHKAYVNFSLARIGDDNCCLGCIGNCISSPSPCACAIETGGEFAYTCEGLVKGDFLKECISMNRDPQKHCLYYCKKNCPLERSKSEDSFEQCKGHLVRKFIKECWYKCGCSKTCGNRVVQRGINHNLQVFMTPKGKGWGLRTLEDLPKGAFVCEYVGEVLTNAELYDRISKDPKGKGHSYPVLLDADWGSEGVLKDEEALCLDATHYGNVARFINHRCGDSNLVEIPVEVETPDHHYYHLAFFTTRNVKALEELTWDYGIDFDDHEHPVKAFQCCCGSKFCRNIKRSNRSRSGAGRRCTR